MSEKNWGATPEEWLDFQLLGLGQDMLPVVSNPNATISPQSKLSSLGKVPSLYNKNGYAVGVPDWALHLATSKGLAEWSANPDLGISLIGRTVQFIDGDVTDPYLAQRVHSRVANYLGRDLPVRFRDNSPKFLLALKLPRSPDRLWLKRVIKTEHGIIEFLGTKQQAVVAGTHPSGARYQWSGLEYHIPEVSEEQFNALWAALQAEFGVEPAVKERATKVVQAEDPLLMALSDKGLVLSTDRDGRVHITCPFEHEHTGPSTESATTYWPAHTGGYAQASIKCLHAHCARRHTEDFEAALGLSDFEDCSGFVAEAESIANMDLFPIQQYSDFAATMQSVHWFVRGIIPRAEFGMIIGPPGCGKSFLGIDLSFAMARGVDWFGGHVKAPVKVAYIAAEGVEGVRMRVRAYEAHHQLPPNSVPLYCVPNGPNMLVLSEVKKLIATLRSVGGVEAVVLDTVAASIPGADESSSSEMSLFIHHCKLVGRALSATVLGVHHVGKDASKGARGWSGLLGAADVQIEVKKDETGRRSFTITKQKDGEDGAVFGFKLLAGVEVGLDGDGGMLTSCIVESSLELPNPAGRAKSTGPNQKKAIDCLRNLCAGSESPFESDFIKSLVGEYGMANNNAHKIVEKLVVDGLFMRVGDRIGVSGQE